MGLTGQRGSIFFHLFYMQHHILTHLAAKLKTEKQPTLFPVFVPLSRVLSARFNSQMKRHPGHTPGPDVGLISPPSAGSCTDTDLCFPFLSSLFLLIKATENTTETYKTCTFCWLYS